MALSNFFKAPLGVIAFDFLGGGRQTPTLRGGNCQCLPSVSFALGLSLEIAELRPSAYRDNPVDTAKMSCKDLAPNFRAIFGE